MVRRAYPSDVGEAEWTILAPLPPPAKPGGRPRSVNLREIVNAISYWLRSGEAWRLLPHDFPPLAHHIPLLAGVATERRVGAPPHRAARAAAGAGGLRPDAQRRDHRQSEREDHGKGGAPNSAGYDGGKKVKGRKRHLLVETSGLVVKTLVHPANVTDRIGGQRLLEAISHLGEVLPRLRHLWVDSAYQGSFKARVEQT